jgi:Putative MetA-pathway of phenol degradation
MERTGRITAVVLAWAMLCGGVATAHASSLSGDLESLFGSSGITLDVQPINPAFPPHTAHFHSATLQALGLLTATLSSQAADFPAISSVPGFTYQYNPNLQVFEPVRGSLGSVFVERPQTLGRGRFDFGLSYAYINFSELDGQDLDHQTFVLHHNDCCGGPDTPDFPAFEDDTITVNFNKFELESNVISLFGTYGVTDRFDVNVLLPVVYTSLRVDSTAQITNTTMPPVHFFDNATQRITEGRSIDDDNFGVGDLQLRGKLRLPDLGGVPVAAGMSMRFPTGSQDNFQGFGDFTLTPFAAAAKDISQFNVHASSGFEIDPEDLSRTRVRYGGGVTWQAIERVALVVDFIGSSNLTSESLDVNVPQFDQNGQQIGTEVATQSVRTDIIDIAPGLKVNLFGTAVGFFTAFVPLNHDGLRANFIPTGGVEMSF